MNCPFCNLNTAGQHEANCPTKADKFDNMIISENFSDWLEQVLERLDDVSVFGVRVLVSEYVPENIIILRQGDQVVKIIDTTDKAD
jgi:hypothetical protein